MFNLLGLIFDEKYFLFRSFLIKNILKLRGIKIGKNFIILGVPYIKFRGQLSNIEIGDNVFIAGNIDLRNRENGKIIIKNNVKIDSECRFVAANNAILTIGEYTSIGPRSIFNCGTNVTLGKKVLLAGGVYINSSAHEIQKYTFIREQGYYHDIISIEDDVFIGANVVINPGVKIKKGSVVGANAVVTKDTQEYSINVGIPSKEIAKRK
jgi:acetyltransferase-like isoleucine patch superfamily enzyme